MDANSRKRMANYLNICCKNEAFVVEDSEAQAEIVDVDQQFSFNSLKERVALNHSRPIIAISIRDVDLENVIFLKKPIKIEQMLNAITKVKGVLVRSKVKLNENIKETSVESEELQTSAEKELNKVKQEEIADIGNMPVKEEVKEGAEKFGNNTASESINVANSSTFIGKQDGKKSSGLPVWSELLSEDVNQKNGIDAQSPQDKRISPKITENSKEQDKKNAVKLKVRAISDKAKEKVKNKVESKERTEFNVNGHIELMPANKNASQGKIIIKEKSKSCKDMSVKGRLKIMADGFPLVGAGQGEIDKMLEDLRSVLGNIEHKLSFFETKNRRKIVRYGFQTIKAKLIKRHLIMRSKRETVFVLNVSSKGALVRLKKPAKFNAKVSLKIYFDRLNIFDVPARIVRKEGEDIYGLQFLNYQHQLADYLVESKKALIILD